MMSLFYNKDKVAEAIGNLVVGSGGQDVIADVLCDIYTAQQRSSFAENSRLGQIIAKLEDLGRLLQRAQEWAE